MSIAERKLAGLFQGAKVSLGPLKLSEQGGDLSLKSFKIEEVAYIVGRYMNANAENGVYVGSVITILMKLWPDDFPSAFEEGKMPMKQSTFMRKLYHWLRQLGYYGSMDPGTGGYRWRIDSSDADSKYQKVVVNQPKPEPVTIKCADCHLPFKNSTELQKHRKESHKSKEIEVATATTKEDASVYQCDECDRVFSSPQGATLHKTRTHNLGRKKLGPTAQKVFNYLKEQEMKGNAGLAPKEIAAVIGKKRGQVSQAVGHMNASDPRHPRVISIGFRHATRYYTSEYWYANKERIVENYLANGGNPDAMPRIYNKKSRRQKKETPQAMAVPVNSGVSAKMIMSWGDYELIDGELYEVVREKVSLQASKK